MSSKRGGTVAPAKATLTVLSVGLETSIEVGVTVGAMDVLKVVVCVTVVIFGDVSTLQATLQKTVFPTARWTPIQTEIICAMHQTQQLVLPVPEGS